MNRPDPIEYAERLYGAIRAANFSPMSFLAFGNAVKEGVAMRSMPRIAVEPFMRIVGEMLDLEEESNEVDEVIDAAAIDVVAAAPSEQSASGVPLSPDIAVRKPTTVEDAAKPEVTEESVAPASPAPQDKRRSNGRR